MKKLLIALITIGFVALLTAGTLINKYCPKVPKVIAPIVGKSLCCNTNTLNFPSVKTIDYPTLFVICDKCHLACKVIQRP